MHLRLLCAAAAIAFCLRCSADPVAITPGGQVTPGTGTFGGVLVNSISDTNKKDTIDYTDMVYADPNNPLCSGCYDFVLQLSSTDGSRFVTSVTTAPFQGDKYELEVAYSDDGLAAPVSAQEGSGGSKITFDFSPSADETDSLIIYTNALSDKSGTLSVTTAAGVTDPPAFAPAGPAFVASTPEPSSLWLLGTGALGFAGTLRRRMLRS